MTDLLFSKSLLTDNSSLDETSFRTYAQQYTSKKEVRQQLAKISERFARSLFNHENVIDTDKAYLFCNELESLAREKDDLYGYAANVAFYIRALASTTEQMTENRIQGCSYTALRGEHHAVMSQILETTQNQCAQNDQLFTAHLINGMCYSFDGRRPEAQSCFETSVKSGSEFIDTAFLDFGAYTYTAKALKTSLPEVEIIGERSDLPSLPIIVISMDEHYLRRFSPYLFWAAQSMEQVHFHFHLIAPLSRKNDLCREAFELDRHIRRFFAGNKNKGSTFSFGTLPEGIGQPKTYYACSRYLIAEQLMQKFDRDIYIMDADLAIESDMTAYLKALQSFDVCLPIARGIRALSPWRRFQAGNVFIRNNEMGRSFLNFAAENINSELASPKSWMLDQNSLSYAYDNVSSDVHISNIFMKGMKRPTTQPPFMKSVREQ